MNAMGNGAAPVDFGAIAQAALARADDLLPRWFPQGKWNGREFKIGNVRGDPGESLSINANTGIWANFAADLKGADLINLRAAIDGVGQLEAARCIAAELGNGFSHGTTPEKQAKPAQSARKRIVATYEYTNADGELAFQVLRYEPKDFRQRRPDGNGGWVWKMEGVERVLYRLPEVRAAVEDGRTIFVAEGEKGADAVAGLGLTATCSPGGAGKWRLQCGAALTGADVVLVGDNDEAGRMHVADVAAKLAGIAARVRVLAPPGLAEKQDIFDWIEAGGTAAELERLAAKAPEFRHAEREPGGETVPPEDGDEAHAEALELSERIRVACKIRKDLRRLWDGDWSNLKDQSLNTRVFAFMGALRRAGFSLADARSAVHLHRDTAEWAREKGDAADGREFSRIWNTLAEGEAKRAAARVELGDFDPTEDGIALAFAKRHANDLRYDHDAGAWFRWDGLIWRKDRTKLAFSWARKLCRDMAEQGGDTDKLAKAATSAAVERFAQADRAFAVTSETWDADDWLLGTPGGTVNLRTGELRPARREDHISKCTAVAPAAIPECRLWLKFLGEITGNDDSLIRFLRQWCGYCLTGSTREHALLFGAGDGGNGKGVFLNTVAGVLGDYAKNERRHGHLHGQQQRPTPDRPRYAGRRPHGDCLRDRGGPCVGRVPHQVPDGR